MLNNDTKSKKTALIVFSAITIIIIAYNYPNFENQLNLHLNTWVSKSFYDSILSIKNQLKNDTDPIVFIAFAPQANILSYYRNIIQMEITNAHLYYGKLDFLIQRQPTPTRFFKTTDDANYSAYYFEETKNVITAPKEFTIVILKELYGIDSTSAKLLEFSKINDGNYLKNISNNNQTLTIPIQVITAYTDYTELSKGFYVLEKDWAYAGSILEYFYENKNPQIYPNVYAKVTYPIWLFNAQNTQMDVHLFDAFDSDWGTLYFSLDNQNIGNYTYEGTGENRWLNFTIQPQDEGFHSLLIELRSINQGILRLDVIQLSSNPEEK